MEKIMALCKARGFVFQGSEIYGGLANSWDYGPLGVALKNNIKWAWHKKFVQESELNVALDAAILMHPQTWVTSGHVGNFSDPLMDCKKCNLRHRADKLIEEHGGDACAMTFEQMEEYIHGEKLACPGCGTTDFTPIRKFNLMFKTFQGVTEDSQSEIFLRPETAQGIFVNFANVQRAMRKKLPFGVCQVGKAFRNEITPGNFTFRTREFEQMEMEFFCKPSDSLEWFEHWRIFCRNWLISLGLTQKQVRLRDHSAEELSHYSRGTTDIEFAFPFGWGELWGIAHRGDFDLTQHQKASGKNLEFYDQEADEHYIPHVIEPSLGADRVMLAFLCAAYHEDQLDEQNSRTVLKLHPALAPYKAAVLPLSKSLGEKAMKVAQDLKKEFFVDFDDKGSIGKRYRRQDEIGTPLCITYDFDSEQDGCVTVRDRDSMQQERVSLDKISEIIREKVCF